MKYVHYKDVSLDLGAIVLILAIGLIVLFKSEDAEAFDRWYQGDPKTYMHDLACEQPGDLLETEWMVSVSMKDWQGCIVFDLTKMQILPGYPESEPLASLIGYIVHTIGLCTLDERKRLFTVHKPHENKSI